MSNCAPELTPQEFERLRALIEERSGIYLPDSRRETLARALAARMTQCGAASGQDYWRRLHERGDDEFRCLLRHITITESAFFRVPSQFAALREVLVPACLEQCATATLNIWSAGCATGEEPYSIAMVLAEMGAALRARRAHILATDISAEALEHARGGRYSERALRPVPPGYRARYFRCRGGEAQVRDDLRQMVEFREFNLASARYPRPQPHGWDIIFCRNVTMYFRPQTARQVMERFHRVLRPGGFLLLGPTESARGVCDDFDTINAAGAFIHVKPPMGAGLAARRTAFDHSGPAAAAPRDLHRPGPRRLAAPTPIERDTSRAEPAGEEQACARALAAIAGDDWDAAEQALAGFAAGGARPRLLLAWLWAMQGKSHGAMMVCMELLARDPLLAPAHHILGLLASRAGDHDQAAEHFSKAIYSDESLVPAHYHLGVTHCSRGDEAAARRAFRGALRALRRGDEGWSDFSEGLSAEHWRRACQARLAALEQSAQQAALRSPGA